MLQNNRANHFPPKTISSPSIRASTNLKTDISTDSNNNKKMKNTHSSACEYYEINSPSKRLWFDDYVSQDIEMQISELQNTEPSHDYYYDEQFCSIIDSNQKVKIHDEPTNNINPHYHENPDTMHIDTVQNNNSGLLLPNPYPKKKSSSSKKFKSLDHKSNNTQSSETIVNIEHLKNQNTIESNSYSYGESDELDFNTDRSFEPMFMKDDTIKKNFKTDRKDDNGNTKKTGEYDLSDEQIKDYTRKFRGKSLMDRIEMIGNEIENTIKLNIQENLAKIKENLVSQRTKSQQKIIEIHVEQANITKHTIDNSNHHRGEYYESLTEREYKEDSTIANSKLDSGQDTDILNNLLYKNQLSNKSKGLALSPDKIDLSNIQYDTITPKNAYFQDTNTSLKNKSSSNQNQYSDSLEKGENKTKGRKKNKVIYNNNNNEVYNSDEKLDFYLTTEEKSVFNKNKSEDNSINEQDIGGMTNHDVQLEYTESKISENEILSKQSHNQNKRIEDIASSMNSVIKSQQFGSFNGNHNIEDEKNTMSNRPNDNNQGIRNDKDTCNVKDSTPNLKEYLMSFIQQDSKIKLMDQYYNMENESSLSSPLCQIKANHGKKDIKALIPKIPIQALKLNDITINEEKEKYENDSLNITGIANKSELLTTAKKDTNSIQKNGPNSTFIRKGHQKVEKIFPTKSFCASKPIDLTSFEISPMSRQKENSNTRIPSSNKKDSFNLSKTFQKNFNLNIDADSEIMHDLKNPKLDSTRKSVKDIDDEDITRNDDILKAYKKDHDGNESHYKIDSPKTMVYSPSAMVVDHEYYHFQFIDKIPHSIIGMIYSQKSQIQKSNSLNIKTHKRERISSLEEKHSLDYFQDSMHRSKPTQEVELLETKCIHLIRQKQYNTALEILVNICKNWKNSKLDAHYIYLSYLIAECYAKINRDNFSQSYAENTIKLIEEIPVLNDKYIFLYYYSLHKLLGNIHINGQKYKQAFEIYRKILDLVESPKKYHTEIEIEKVKLLEEIWSIKLNMANALFNIDEMSEALKYYNEVYDSLKVCSHTESKKRMILCLKKIAFVYIRLKKYKKALSYYSEILKIYMLSRNDDKVITEIEKLKDFCYIYAKMGYLYSTLNNHKDSIKCYQSALKLNIQVYGEYNNYTALAYLSLAKSLFNNGEYDKSFNAYWIANEILEKLGDHNTIQTANCYVSMAQIKYKLKDYQQAADLYEIALDIYQRTLGKHHLYTYRIYLNLLFLNFLLKNQFKINFFEQKLASSLDEANFNVCTILNEIGNIFRKNKVYQKAEHYYKKSIGMFDIINKEEIKYESLALVYCNLASVNLVLKNHNDGITHYKIALKIFENIEGNDYTERKARISLNIGKIYQNIEAHKEALKFLKISCELYKQLDNKPKITEIEELIEENSQIL